MSTNVQQAVCGIFFATIYLSFSANYYLPTYPSFFWLMTFAGGAFLYFWYQYTQGHYYTLQPILIAVLFFWLWGVASCLWAEHLWITPEGLRRSTVFTFITFGLFALFCRYPSFHKNISTPVLIAMTIVALCYTRAIFFNKWATSRIWVSFWKS